MTSLEKAQGLLAYLRFLSWEYQVAHWSCSGPNFFSDHNLFERLYGEALSLIDPLAERMTGQWGSVAVDPYANVQILHALTTSSTKLAGDLMASKMLAFARGAESICLSLRQELENDGLLTTGWEDLLDGQVHLLETHEYLLQQRLEVLVANQDLEESWFADTSVAEYYKVATGSSESFFHDNPDKRSIRELSESGALSNLPESGLDQPDAPPTPTENVENTPGSEELSTLSRFLIQTDQPTVDDVPSNRDELPMHPVLASWSFMEGE